MHLRPQFEPLARLAAAGFGLFGSRDLRWVHLFSRTQLFGSLISRGCVCPAGCCCGGYAAGARLGWLCPYNLGEHCTAPADMLQLHGTLPASFPLINNRPLSERAAGASRRGSGGAQTFPYGCTATGPDIAGLWHGKAYTRVLRGLGAARRCICADGICACLSQMYLFIIRK